MEANIKRPEVIEKEEVVNLRFPAAEVLISADDIKARKTELDKALKLGNVEHGKIKIIFEDANGIKQIETTIWGVTDKRIILKQGIVLPIHRIHEIKI
ncbi:MAG: hypothetical protein HYU69_06080 [Bacteroidetes bacterium]|nr:hypothetical protein [Bacteroidota bacterium]